MPKTLDSLAQSRRNALADEQSYATTLLAVLLDTYGTEATAWDPETIRLEIESDFELQLPPTNFDRLMAGVGILTRDDFYTAVPDFIWYCNILSGSSYT